MRYQRSLRLRKVGDTGGDLRPNIFQQIAGKRHIRDRLALQALL